MWHDVTGQMLDNKRYQSQFQSTKKQKEFSIFFFYFLKVLNMVPSKHYRLRTPGEHASF